MLVMYCHTSRIRFAFTNGETPSGHLEKGGNFSDSKFLYHCNMTKVCKRKVSPHKD